MYTKGNVSFARLAKTNTEDQLILRECVKYPDLISNLIFSVFLFTWQSTFAQVTRTRAVNLTSSFSTISGPDVSNIKSDTPKKSEIQAKTSENIMSSEPYF